MKLVIGNSLKFKAEICVQEEPKIKKIRRTSTKKTDEAFEKFVFEIDFADIKLRFPNDELNTSSSIAVDTETTGLDVWFDDEPWMVSMADSDGNSWATSWAVNPYTRRIVLKETEEWKYLKSIIEDASITKVYFNAWFDIRNLRKLGIYHRGPIEEVALKARAANTDEFSYKLKYLSKRKLGLDDDDEKSLKKLVSKLKRIAKKFGLKVFNAEETTNSKAKDDSIPADYWLVMYASHFPGITKEEAELAKSLAEEYCRKDTIRTILLSDYYSEKFEADEARKKFYEFELQLLHVVDAMESRGIRVYEDVARREKENCRLRADELLKEIREEVGYCNFNPSSPAQVAEYLFSEAPNGLGLPPTEQTPTGQCKTGQKEIGHLTYIPFISKLFEYKASEKAITLFFDKYIDNLMPEKDYTIIHPQVHQSNTRTFRFSMSNPNLQQAANPESSAGKNVIQVRNAFGPRPGYVWAMMDYSAQEFIILGAMMKIKAIIDAVANGEDIPTVLGNKTWGGRNNIQAIKQVIESLEFEKQKPSSEHVAKFWKEIGYSPGMFSNQIEAQVFAENVFKDVANYNIVELEKHVEKKTVRTRTKMCLYGKAYGAGVNGVMSLLRCKEKEARKWLSELDKSFPEMRREGKKWVDEASRLGYVVNAYGRKIDVPRDRPYVAVNYRIQGTAADMMKVSMLRCFNWINELGLDISILLTVHDELIFEIKEEHSFLWVWKGLKERMEDHLEYLSIPISCGVSKVTHSWDVEEKMDHLFKVA